MTGQLSVRFRTYGPLSRRAKFQILALVPIYFIVAGFFFTAAV